MGGDCRHCDQYRVELTGKEQEEILHPEVEGIGSLLNTKETRFPACYGASIEAGALVPCLMLEDSSNCPRL